MDFLLYMFNLILQSANYIMYIKSIGWMRKDEKGMKRTIVNLAILVSLIALVGCANADKENENRGQAAREETTEEETTEEITEEESTEDTSETMETEKSMESKSGSTALYNGDTGPLTYAGTIKDGFTVYQYNVANGEKKEVFSFDNSSMLYSTTVDLQVSALHTYQLKAIFSPDMSKLAVSWKDRTDGANKVGWIDKNGNLTNITDKIHPVTSDFSSIVPDDSTPIFTPEGQFMFSDHNAEKYIFVDVNTLEAVREEDVLRQKNYDNPIWEVFILPNGKINAVISPGLGEYRYIDFGDIIVSIRGGVGIDGIRNLGAYGFDFIDTGVVAGILGERLGDFDVKTSIIKYGIGITAPDTNGVYFGEEDGKKNQEEQPKHIKLTPATDYRIESCAYHNGKICFIASRGEDRFFFLINDGMGEQEVKQVVAVPFEERLLFWR